MVAVDGLTSNISIPIKKETTDYKLIQNDKLKDLQIWTPKYISIHSKLFQPCLETDWNICCDLKYPPTNLNTPYET